MIPDKLVPSPSIVLDFVTEGKLHVVQFRTICLYSRLHSRWQLEISYCRLFLHPNHARYLVFKTEIEPITRTFPIT